MCRLAAGFGRPGLLPSAAQGLLLCSWMILLVAPLDATSGASSRSASCGRRSRARGRRRQYSPPPLPLRMHMVGPMCQHVWFLIFVTSCGASFLDLLDSASCSASLGCCLASNKEAHQEAPSAAQTRSRRVSRQCTAAVCAQRVLDWVACCLGVQSCCATCMPGALGGRGSARPGVLPGLHRPTSPCCGARRGPYVLWVVRPSAHPPAHPPLPCFPFSPPCRLPARSAVAVGPAGGGAGHFLPLRLRLLLQLPRGGAPAGGLRDRAQVDGERVGGGYVLGGWTGGLIVVSGSA